MVLEALCLADWSNEILDLVEKTGVIGEANKREKPLLTDPFQRSDLSRRSNGNICVTVGKIPNYLPALEFGEVPFAVSVDVSPAAAAQALVSELPWES